MTRRPVIVMGADVTHPAPGETKKPSIAAVSRFLQSLPTNITCRIEYLPNTYTRVYKYTSYGNCVF